MIDVNEILANPTVYDRNEVEVCGLYINGREHRAIYSSAEEMKNYHGLWLVQEAGAAGGESSVKKLNGKKVRVVGVFHNKSHHGSGHFNAWPGEIRKITVIEERDENHT